MERGDGDPEESAGGGHRQQVLGSQEIALRPPKSAANCPWNGAAPAPLGASRGTPSTESDSTTPGVSRACDDVPSPPTGRTDSGAGPGPRGRRFESCLPDSMQRERSGNPSAPRPAFFRAAFPPQPFAKGAAGALKTTAERPRKRCNPREVPRCGNPPRLAQVTRIIRRRASRPRFSRAPPPRSPRTRAPSAGRGETASRARGSGSARTRRRPVPRRAVPTRAPGRS